MDSDVSEYKVGMFLRHKFTGDILEIVGKHLCDQDYCKYFVTNLFQYPHASYSTKAFLWTSSEIATLTYVSRAAQLLYSKKVIRKV